MDPDPSINKQKSKKNLTIVRHWQKKQDPDPDVIGTDPRSVPKYHGSETVPKSFIKRGLVTQVP
jgi:hypothetical protein